MTTELSFAANTDSNGPGSNVLDTGTTSLLSEISCDFHGDRLARVKIVGIGEPIYGERRKTVRNLYGFKTGVQVDLPGGISRLVPVPENWLLQEYETGKSGYIVDKSNPANKVELIHSVPPKLRNFICDSEDVVCYRASGVAKPSVRLLHERLCHLRKCKSRTCLACRMAKSVRRRCKRARKERYRSKRPLAQLDVDYLGPVSPTSQRGFSMALCILDVKSGMFWGVPAKGKLPAPEIRRLIRELRSRYGRNIGVRVVYFVRSDNDPCFMGDFSQVLKISEVLELKPSPYNPSLNGNIERLVRKIVMALKSMLINTDPKCWCWGLEYLSLVSNSIKTPETGKAPLEVCEELLEEGDPRRTPGLKERDEQKLPFRRFGSLCVCHIEDPVLKRAHVASGQAFGKFLPSWIPGIYLGRSGRKGSNCDLVHWARDGSGGKLVLVC